MDLESTLVRAEALCRKFRRLVEAMDNKHNFPAPRLADASGTVPAGPARRDADAAGPGRQEVISPELRKLLSREFEVLPRRTVAQKGDGMPAA